MKDIGITHSKMIPPDNDIWYSWYKPLPMTITKDQYPDLWDDFIEDVYDESYNAHRKGASYFVKNVYLISKEWFPEAPDEIIGFWETDVLIGEYDWEKEKPTVLHKVEQVKKITYEWKRVSKEDVVAPEESSPKT